MKPMTMDILEHVISQMDALLAYGGDHINHKTGEMADIEGMLWQLRQVKQDIYMTVYEAHLQEIYDGAYGTGWEQDHELCENFADELMHEREYSSPEADECRALRRRLIAKEGLELEHESEPVIVDDGEGTCLFLWSDGRRTVEHYEVHE